MIRKWCKKIALVLTIAAIGTSFSANTVLAQGFDTTFYSGNDITFWDPSACSTSSDTGEVEGNDNLEKILRYFTGKGLTLAQAAGIAGNMQQESWLDPTMIQGLTHADENYRPVADVGFGLVQWTTSDRQQGLVDYAEETNRSIIDLSMQLDYVWVELEGSYKSTLEKLRQTTNPVDAAVVVHDGYEVSQDNEQEVINIRGGNAQSFFDEFEGIIADGAGAGSGSGSYSCAQEDSEFADDGFVIFNQCDDRWGGDPYIGGGGQSTICESGCGPAAMAMAITALTSQTVTPADTIEYANTQNIYVPGTGSAWTVAPILAEHWNLNAENISNSVAAINEVLRNGGLVVTSGSGAAPFTSGGHYIVIRGVSEDGKWKVGDSNGTIGQQNSLKLWDPQQILDIANADNIVAITK
jgi:hypothetical protein